MTELSLIARARRHASKTAIGGHPCWTYDDLLDRSAAVSQTLLAGETDLREARVAFLLPPGIDYVAAQWGVWRAGGIAVPLSHSATSAELEYTLSDSQASMILTTPELDERLGGAAKNAGVPTLSIQDVGPSSAVLPQIVADRRAMILYTSGTTSRPKGVVSTHANIEAQIVALIDAWRWQAEDHIPLFLPLHHIHGIINVMSCALWSGATITPFPRFDLEPILDRVAANDFTLFMAVPTIYVKLIQHLKSLPAAQRDPIVAGFAKMRLMVSGSAALPATVHQAWTELTTQKLLERYGMTEIGMALSNPYHGERRPGAVGQPLPGVEIRLVTEQGDVTELGDVTEQGNVVAAEGEPGEIQVRGPCVFHEYWNRPEATSESFVDGWFRTGDIAVLEQGYFRIMGRQSVDIIKSGGYKLSALEIESVLLEHPAIAQSAVVGIEDETWGEAVVAAVVLVPGESLDTASLRQWCRDRLSPYKIPKQLLPVDQLPKNAMGKVQKPAVKKLFTTTTEVEKGVRHQ